MPAHGTDAHRLAEADARYEFAQLPTAAITAKFPASTLRVYTWLDLQVGRMRKRDSRIFVSQRQIAQATGCGQRTVNKAIGLLVTAGLIAIEREPDNAGGRLGYMILHRVTPKLAQGYAVNGVGSDSRPLSRSREQAKRTSPVSTQAGFWDHGPYERAIRRE